MPKDQHPLDWNAKLVKFFFENSRLVWLTVIIFIIGGLAGLLTLRKEGFPQVQIKSVFVQTVYPGAGSSEVESKVTKILESAFKDLRGMKDFSSISASNYSQITVNFDESSNLDQVITDVQSKVSSTEGSLPSGAQTPKVVTISTGGPAFAIGVTGGNSDTLHDRATTIADRLSQLSGIKSATNVERPTNLNINLKYDQLAKYQISPLTISQILQINNLNFPVGSLSDLTHAMPITVEGAFSSADEVGNLVVGSQGVQPILLKDVASISESFAARDDIARIGYTKNGKLISVPAESVMIQLTSIADVIAMRSTLDQEIQKMRDDSAISKDTETIFLYDQSKSTSNQVKEIVESALGAKKNLYLLGGVQLLFIAMLLLVNWRAALIAALSLPLSFAFTFLTLLLMGIQLNTLVLFALILVLGLVVDPAIVMVEAIQRYRELHLDESDSVIESGRRYGASLFMAVLTSLIVFVPFGVVSGFFGEIISYLPKTVIPALIASYFVPIALLPYLTRKLFKKSPKTVAVSEIAESEELGSLANWVMKINRWLLDKWYRAVGLIAFSFVLVLAASSLVATKKIPIVQFGSPEDNQLLSIQASYKPGASYQARDAAYKSVEEAILPEKGVSEFYSLMQSQSSFWMYINLKDASARTAETDKSKKIVERIRERTKNILNISDLNVSEVSVGPPASNFQLNTQLSSNDLGKLKTAAIDLGNYMKGLDHVLKVDDGFTDKAVPEVQIAVKRDQLASHGLSVLDVANQLKGVLSTADAGKFESSGGEPVNLKLGSESTIKSISDIENFKISTAHGLVGLQDLANISQVDGIATIEHYNGARFVSVQARIDDQNNLLAIQNKVNDYLTKDRLQKWGIDSILNKGDAFDISKSFTELGIALLIAILLTYLVLVLQFKSFTLPLIMLFTIPLSFIGVFPALYLTHSQFGFLELLGITILVGIVENVAIFLIDYANQLVREKGMSPKEAIILASGVRFRPILLTKLVALGGLLPLAIESPFWRGLSVVIIAGIGVSGFLSILIIPYLYDVLMRARIRWYGQDKV